MILYLRLCLVHGGGISCDTDSVSSMQDVSPQVALYVRQLLQVDASDSAPVILYLQFIQKLLSAMGGKGWICYFCLIQMINTVYTETT
jgi:hypothetical protein